MVNALNDAIALAHEMLTERKLTVSAAESCTGGLVCHCLTFLPGASAFFRAGIVAYSNESKVRLLGIPSELLDTYGAISKECAMEMAERVRLMLGSDYSIATTGNLGPGVLEGKERGLVYVAVGKEGGTFTKRLKIAGEREEVKERAAVEALRFLVEIMKAEAPFG